MSWADRYLEALRELKRLREEGTLDGRAEAALVATADDAWQRLTDEEREAVAAAWTAETKRR